MNPVDVTALQILIGIGLIVIGTVMILRAF